MLKIGEFSKLSHLTIKALRFYEKEGILLPKTIDQRNGYRFYETGQLAQAAMIKSYRQLGMSIEEIKAIQNGENHRIVLKMKEEMLRKQKEDIDIRLSIIQHILEDNEMKYQVTVKEIPETIVYYTEALLKQHSDIMKLIPELGAECMKLNPNIKCTNPEYEFCEYLDEEYKDRDILIRHNEAVETMGKENDRIKFRIVPATKVLSIFHKGAYEEIGEAYAFLMKYAEENGYKQIGPVRESYIDGIWNIESVSDWLTEIQLPIE